MAPLGYRRVDHYPLAVVDRYAGEGAYGPGQVTLET
jgi:hypothetical protein